MAMRWRWPPDRRGAALADHRLVAVGQRHDEVVRVGGAGGGDEFGLGGVGAAEAQVVLDRAVEQVGVLRDHGDHAADRVGIERAQILAADADGAGLRIVQAQQQAHDGGFAGAAGADDADALAGGDGERQAAMRRAAAAGIGEADVARRRCWLRRCPSCAAGGMRRDASGTAGRGVPRRACRAGARAR